MLDVGDAGYWIPDADYSGRFGLAGLGAVKADDGCGERRIRRRRDHNMALSLIGKADRRNSFGENLLIDKKLHRKMREKEAEKARRRPKNIFGDLRKWLEINGIFFGACPGL